jgi:N-acyl-D-aspartate/D-glutamate deacylase
MRLRVVALTLMLGFGTVVWLAGSADQAPAVAVQQADLVLLNGRVYTVDAARPWAEAIAVSGDRILAVGSTAEIRGFAGPASRVIDLRGAFVTPGFNDGHVHVESTGALLTGANLLDVHDAARFRERVAACRRVHGSRAATGARTSNGGRVLQVLQVLRVLRVLPVLGGSRRTAA